MPTETDWKDLEGALAVRLPGDVKSFWDDGAQPENAPPFFEPLTFEQLASAQQTFNMPPDYLPLVGNGAGDFLCLRLSPDGTTKECVFFTHDDWSSSLPVGRSLSEALLVEACGFEEEEDRAQVAKVLEWVLTRGHLPASARERLSTELAEGESLKAVLIDLGIGLETLAIPPVTASGSRSQLDARFFKHHKLTAVDPAVFWYDLSRLPDKVARVLKKTQGALKEPDWSAMEQAKDLVLRLRDDIGWAHMLDADLAGWRGDWTQASCAVDAAANCLEGTFSVHGAHHFAAVLAQVDRSKPVTRCFVERDREGMSRYWREQVTAHEARGEWAAAWDAWYRYFFQMQNASANIDDHREHLMVVAKNAGFTCYERLLARNPS